MIYHRPTKPIQFVISRRAARWQVVKNLAACFLGALAIWATLIAVFIVFGG